MKSKTDGQTSSGLTSRAGTVLLSLSCLGALALAGGCASEPASHVVSAPPPAPPAKTVTTTTTTTTPTTMVVATSGNVTTATPVVSTTVVTQAPPVPQTEIAQPQPSNLHAWIPGYWTWRNERYEWLAGRWELPPRSSAVWVAPRWEREGNAYRFYEGYWN